MAFDPRCVAFEGRLHADHCTAAYIGRASHELDAACFRSIRSASTTTRSQMLRMFYYETQIMATCDKNRGSTVPVQQNTSTVPVSNRPHSVHGQDTVQEDTGENRGNVSVSASTPLAEMVDIPVSIDAAFQANGTTLSELQSRITTRRIQHGNEKKRFAHKIAIGFLLDKAHVKFEASGTNSSSCTRFLRSSGFFEAKVSRDAIKQLMERVLPHVAARDEKKQTDDDEKDKKTRGPAISHEDLGTQVNAVAYVGKTGRVISHGREFLQCERYGAGDVVGCGVLFDTKTFFFTLNGQLMGVLESRDVFDMDTFRDFEDMREVERDEDDDDELENDEEDEKEHRGGGENSVRAELERKNDEKMEDIDECYEEDNVLFPSVSLHGIGERVRAVFEPDEFQFDLSSFGQQIQKQRQQALLAEREKHIGSPSSLEQALCKDEAAMDKLVQDFFWHYGYESAYKAFESALAFPKRQRLTSTDIEMDHGDEVKTIAVFHDVSSVDNRESEDKMMDVKDAQLDLHSSTKQMYGSLALRHQVRENIRSFRTVQALEMLEQHVPALMTTGRRHCSRRFDKLMLYCQILCVIDVLTYDEEAKAPSLSPSLASDAPRLSKTSNPEQMVCNGWNAESAIAFARQVFGPSSETSTNGKRKRLGRSNRTYTKRADRDEIALVMSLLLYNQCDSIPKTSHARKYLTFEFRDAVADQLNNVLLIGDDYAKTEPRMSALEIFMTDLDALQKECVHQGCRVYPESTEATSNVKSKTTLRRWKVSVSSSSDDSSSSPSSQDDCFDDDE